MRWNVSITRRLYLIIGTMAFLLALELATLRFSMRTLSAVRAFVAGEGSWSKAQKNAALAMERYAATRDEIDFQEFLEFLKIPEGDHRARMELLKPEGDLAVARAGFLAGHVHPDDVEPAIELVRHFAWISYLKRALEQWERADELLAQFRSVGMEWHRLLEDPSTDPAILAGTRRTFQSLNEQLTTVEDEFSGALGEGSRWLERVAVFILVLAVLVVETIGLTLTLVTARALSRGLNEIQTAATRIGEGHFSTKLPIRSHDELGSLSASINHMAELLERSYAELEQRVLERTAELEKLAADNARLYEEATTAVRLREEFFSVASHDLRTPLTSLHLQPRLLQKSIQAAELNGATAQKLSQQISACIRQTTRLTTLSSNLLDITKVRLGKLELHTELCDLAGLALEGIAQLQDEAARAGSVVEFHGAGPVAGHFDATRMTQVVTNLLSNALKYGEGKPVDVTVEALPESGRARLVVADHGRGIPIADQARIFRRFERAEKDASIPGLGLGLYVSQQIVEAHGGRLSVTSDAGKGTTFLVEVPAETMQEPNPAADQTS